MPIPGTEIQNNRKGIFHHLNGNILCAIDVETTGFDPDRHEIWQICILPLDHKVQPLKGVVPFYMDITPLKPETMDPEARKIGKFELANLINNGIDPYKAADLLLEWFEKLPKAEHKRISPLAQNWPFDRSFLIQWLGPRTFNLIFDGVYRDTMAAATFVNDKCDWHSEACPYHRVNLATLCTITGAAVGHRNAHDAMDDARVTAEVYRRILMDLTE